MITLRSCSSKWVNNQMEVNDRPRRKSGGGGAKHIHIQGFLRLKNLYSRWSFTGSFFLDELEL